MLTVAKLKEFGADTDKGLSRCVNNEALYFKLINMAAREPGVKALGEALEEGDLDKAFAEAHKLKGVAGNLSLDPIFEPASKLTELLRNKTPGDYGQLYSEITNKIEKLKVLID